MESSIWPESVPSNRIQAIQALTEGQEMINILCEMLLRPKKIDSTGPISEDGLVVRIQGMFENTLSIMSSCSSNESIQLMTSDVHSPCSSDEEKLKYSDIHKTITPAKIKRGRCYKKSKNTWTSTQITSVLADDGHAWRKYGQKQILNSKHQRSYYRCTYKFDQGCLATKQVQQIQNSPPKYKTIYSGDHTCKNLQRAPAIVLDFPEPRDTSIHLISFENKGYIENIHAEPNFSSIKQELKEGFPLTGSFRHNEPSFSNNYLSVDYQNTCISRRPLEQISMTPFGHGGIISSNAYSYTASTDGHGTEVDTSEDLKELMENEVYVPLSSIILTTNPIPDVKGDFATLSRDESHKSTQSHNMSKSEDELSSEPNDDERDSRSKIDKGTDQFSHVGTENTGDATRDDVGHPDDNTSGRLTIKGSKWVFKAKYKSSGEVERCLFTIVMHKNWPIYQLDINNAFMYGELVEDVYMSLLEGYFDKADNRDLGKLKYFFGIKVLELNGNLYLTQRNYCLDALAEFGMLACTPCGTPLETKECTAKPKKVYVDSPLTSINNYQKLVGKLIYLTHTRPDISYVVHVLSHYMIAPLQSHLKLAFRVLKYLKNAFGKGIYLVKDKELNLNVFVDFDWAKCKAIRKAVTCYTLCLGKSLIF
ncbi:probable WRKY transcription factor 70 [Tanacetum coccineum]